MTNEEYLDHVGRITQGAWRAVNYLSVKIIERVFNDNSVFLLHIDNKPIVSSSRYDLLYHKQIAEFEGEVLLTGLGLGIGLLLAEHNPKITAVDVIEINPHVGIALQGTYPNTPKLRNFIVGNAETPSVLSLGTYGNIFIDHRQLDYPDELLDVYRQHGNVITGYSEGMRLMETH
jgi:hypothetical protein